MNGDGREERGESGTTVMEWNKYKTKEKHFNIRMKRNANDHDATQ